MDKMFIIFEAHNEILPITGHEQIFDEQKSNWNNFWELESCTKIESPPKFLKFLKLFISKRNTCITHHCFWDLTVAFGIHLFFLSNYICDDATTWGPSSPAWPSSVSLILDSLPYNFILVFS
jgi:hypothetical protein